MKVCLISGEYPPMQGGVGDYTRELACALLALGVEVHVITSARAAARSQARSTAECRSSSQGRRHSAGAPWLTTSGQPPIVHPNIARWGWRSLATIQRLLDDVVPDIVHIQYQTAAYGMHPAINFLPLWLRRRRPHLRTVITYHDLRVPYLFPKAGRLRWWVTLAPARWSHAVIVTNPEDWSKLEIGGWRLETGDRGFDLQSPISNLQSPVLIPIGSNIHPSPPPGFDRTAWRERWGVRSNEILLVYFGFLNASKGGETLVEALAELVRRGHPVRLMMLGGQVGDSDPTNRAYLERVQRLIEAWGVSDRVFWTGFLPPEEVSAALLSADLAVLPYRDGASFRRGSLMAVLAHGVPVVTTHPRPVPDVPPLADVPRLVDGVNARLVPPDDPSALADAIADLSTDPGLRRHLGEGARELAQAFTWDKIAAKTRAVYEQLLDA